VVIFNCKEIKPSSSVVKGMKSMLDRCAGCEVAENSTPLAEWATALSGKAQSEVTRNPNANYFLPIFDDMAIFVTAGVRQAGATGRVKVASFNGTPAALKFVQEGDVFVADPGQSNNWIGWHSIDQAMRGMLGAKPSNPEIPIRFFDETNLRDVNVDDIDALYGNPQFRDGFTQLWGVG
jgi:ribose transport system substrate-binding protein